MSSSSSSFKRCSQLDDLAATQAIEPVVSDSMSTSEMRDIYSYQFFTRAMLITLKAIDDVTLIVALIST